MISAEQLQDRIRKACIDEPSVLTGFEAEAKDLGLKFKAKELKLHRIRKIDKLLSLRSCDDDIERLSNSAALLAYGFISYTLNDYYDDAMVSSAMATIDVDKEEMDCFAREEGNRLRDCFCSSDQVAITLIFYRCLLDAMCEGCGITTWSERHFGKKYRGRKGYALQQLRTIYEFFSESFGITCNTLSKYKWNSDSEDSEEPDELEGEPGLEELLDFHSDLVDSFYSFFIAKATHTIKVAVLMYEYGIINNSIADHGESALLSTQSKIEDICRMMSADIINPEFKGSYCDKYMPFLGSEYSEAMGNQAKILAFSDKLHEETEYRFVEIRKEYDSTLSSSKVYQLIDTAVALIIAGSKFYTIPSSVSAFDSLLTMLNLPQKGLSRHQELEDKDEWDYDKAIGCQGELEALVLSDEDFVSRPEFYPQEDRRLSFIISNVARLPLNAPIYLRKSLVSYLVKQGIDEQKARDCAVIAGTLTAMKESPNVPVIDPTLYSFPYISPEPEKEANTEPSVETDYASEKLEFEKETRELSERIRKLEKQAKEQRHQISLLEKDKKALEEEKKGLYDLISAFEYLDEGEKPDSGKSDALTFPYKLQGKYALFGGFPRFQEEISKLLPDLKCVSIAESNRIDLNQFSDAEIIFIQRNRMSHPCFYQLRDYVHSCDKDLIVLETGGFLRCAHQIVECDKRRNRKE